MKCCDTQRTHTHTGWSLRQTQQVRDVIYLVMFCPLPPENKLNNNNDFKNKKCLKSLYIKKKKKKEISLVIQVTKSQNLPLKFHSRQSVSLFTFVFSLDQSVYRENNRRIRRIGVSSIIFPDFLNDICYILNPI